MDGEMPLMDGIAATRRIREHECARGLVKTPIVVATAHALPQDRASSLRAGLDGDLVSPYSLGELEGVLMRWLSPEAAEETGRR
ncbi:response regulator [Thiorhodococcus minor]